MLVEIKKVNKEEIRVVSSLDVAETFEKEHRRVLQDIRELQCSDEFLLHNFVQLDYLNEKNHRQPMYLMTRDEFTKGMCQFFKIHMPSDNGHKHFHAHAAVFACSCSSCMAAIRLCISTMLFHHSGWGVSAAGK